MDALTLIDIQQVAFDIVDGSRRNAVREEIVV
jgi:hypothetical protein